MNIVARSLAALLPLALVARAGTQDQQSAARQDTAPANAATLRMGQLDTGFLFFGNTRIGIVWVDGERSEDPGRALQLSPGRHTFLVTAFRDPVLAYACITASLDAGKSYVVRTTKPYMEHTTIWIEESATGALAGAKVSAQMIKRVVTCNPALNQLLFGSPPDRC